MVLSNVLKFASLKYMVVKPLFMGAKIIASKFLKDGKDWEKNGKCYIILQVQNMSLHSVDVWCGTRNPKGKFVSRTPETETTFLWCLPLMVKFTLGSYIFLIFILKLFGFSNKITFSFFPLFPDEHIYCFYPRTWGCGWWLGCPEVVYLERMCI